MMMMVMMVMMMVLVMMIFLQAVGEPPLFLAASVFFALKDAVVWSRAEAGLSGPCRLDSPATPERIRLACQDRFTALV